VMNEMGKSYSPGIMKEDEWIAMMINAIPV
jgi:hypothetical protein